jgi:hypothetical protein
MRITLFLLIITSKFLFASNIANLLLDIQNTNKVDLHKHNLTQGYNNKEQAFISIGESFFDFNQKTFLEDKRKFSLVAFINAKTTISKFLSSNMNAKDKLVSKDYDMKITSKKSLNSKNLLKNSFGIFQEEFLNKNTKIYTIKSYILWVENINNIKIKTQDLLHNYISKLDLTKTFGNRIFIDRFNNKYLLSFSIYPLTGNMWTDKISSKGLAKRDMTSMLNSNINTNEKLNNNKNSYSSNENESLNYNSKNIDIIFQKKILDSKTHREYFLTISSYQIKR